MVPVWDWPDILPNWSVIFSGQSMEVTIVSVYFQNLLKGTKHVWTPNTNERKWRQPRLQLHLVTKSRGRRELGLPTWSAAVLPLKMMPCTTFPSIQTFSVNGNFTERYHISCARIDLFTIFVCSRYRPWDKISLLHHFGFVMCINSRLYCTHFSCHWRKIRNVSCRLMQISKMKRDPCMYMRVEKIYTV